MIFLINIKYILVPGTNMVNRDIRQKQKIIMDRIIFSSEIQAYGIYRQVG